MKAIRAIVLVALIAAAAAVAASESAPLRTTDRLPGVDLTEGISQITGAAISPLLGVSTVGAWRYFRTPPSQRERLPWFCQPFFWGAGFFLVGLCLLKDVFGTAAPALVKKPLDMAELFENKLSALVASVAFLPFIAAQMAGPLADGHAVAQPAYVHAAYALPLQTAASPLSAYWIVLPLVIGAFIIVWLTAHAINVLITLCPFGFLDALLKLARFSVLSSVVVSYIVNPWLGAAVALAVIGIAAVLAPWAFRLTVFGTLLAIDTVLPARGARYARPDSPHAFLARRVGAVPVRTLGRLTRDERENTCFEYRPWLILGKRTVALPAGSLAISKGVLFPSLIHSAEGAAFASLVNFPPRYRGREAAIAARFGIAEVRDGTLVRGFRTIRAWFGYTLGLQR